MNVKTIALYLSLGLTSSLLVGAGVNAEQPQDMSTMAVNSEITDVEEISQNSAEAEMPEAQVKQLDILEEVKALQEQGQRLLKGEFPNVHDLDDDDDDDCYEDDDDSDDDFEDDDFEDDDDDLDDEHCDYEEGETKGS